MNYEIRENLAVEFAALIHSALEDKSREFAVAANENGFRRSDLLARLLVSIAEETIETTPCDADQESQMRIRESKTASERHAPPIEYCGECS